jgi:hypothetical protein
MAVAVPIVMAAMSALSAWKGARDQRKLMEQLAQRGGAQLNWKNIQKTYGQMFGGPGVMQNRPDTGTPGGLMAQAFINALQNAGQLSPISYVRGQEQANQAQQALSNRGVGQMSQLGMGFNTPLAQSAWGAGPMAGANARNEILRNMVMAQEQKAMQDRAFGAQGIGGMLNSAIGLRQAKGSLLQGGAGMQAQSPNEWSSLSTGLGLMGNYFANNQKDPNAQPTFAQPDQSDPWVYGNMDQNWNNTVNSGWSWNNPNQGYSFTGQGYNTAPPVNTGYSLFSPSWFQNG